MLRGSLAPESGFRWRGGEISRLEAFSDAVFAFAVTLLVVSLEVPKTYGELIEVMKGFLPFAICFAMLAQLWYRHAKYFRRYGLQDAYSSFLNSVLLFVVLFYVYPLKFLFTVLVGSITHGATLPEAVRHGEPMLLGDDSRTLMMIYGAGYAAVFAIFALMYWNAWRKRNLLELDDIELLKTRRELTDSVANASIGILSILTAAVLPHNLAGLAGYVYFLIGVYHWWSGAHFGKLQRALKPKTQPERSSAKA